MFIVLIIFTPYSKNSVALLEKYTNLRRTSKRLINESRENFFASLSNNLPSNPKISGPFSKRPPSPVAFHRMYAPLQAIQTPRVWFHKHQIKLLTCLMNTSTPCFLKIADENRIPTSPISAEIISDIILDPSDLYNVLFHLDPNKASGPDNISIRLLKECATSITTSLTCLLTSTRPSEWNSPT